MHFKVLLAVTLVLLLCVYFLSLAYKQNRNIANIIETFEPLKRDGPASTRELIDVRNEMSRLLNRKQQELAKLQCETFGEEKRTEKVTRTGGWCINDTNEKDQYEGGHHRTDVQLAAALAELLKGKRVASFGDGPGRYKEIIDGYDLLIAYDAYDGAPYSDIFTEGRVQFLDLSIPQYGLPLYDYIISIEVAEHIPKKYENIYLDNLFRHAKEGIILSWARPGQGGHSHVNNKSFENIKKIMEGNGFEHDAISSSILQKSCSVGFEYFSDNINVFKRKQIDKDLLEMYT